MKRALTAIVAAGDFPKPGSLAWRLMEQADRIVACDRAGEAAKNAFGNVICVGDGDSGKVDVKIEEQDTNDLEKAYRYANDHPLTGDEEMVILGAGGKREDHMLGNIFRAMEWGVKTVTDYGVFYPLAPGETEIKTGTDMAVSVFALERGAKMTSEGLKWPLDRVEFSNLYCATLNRSTMHTVKLTTNKRGFAYVAFAE